MFPEKRLPTNTDKPDLTINIMYSISAVFAAITTGIAAPVFAFVGLRMWITGPFRQTRAIGMNLFIGSVIGFVAFYVIVLSWP